MSEVRIGRDEHIRRLRHDNAELMEMYRDTPIEERELRTTILDTVRANTQLLKSIGEINDQEAAEASQAIDRIVDMLASATMQSVKRTQELQESLVAIVGRRVK